MDFSSLPQYPDRPPRPGPTPEPPKEQRGPSAAAARFRLARWSLVGAFILFLPLMSLSFALGLPLGLMWLLFAAVIGVGQHVVYNFRCPQCEKTFAWAWWWHSPFTNTCLHCGYRLPPRHRRSGE